MSALASDGGVCTGLGMPAEVSAAEVFTMHRWARRAGGALPEYLAHLADQSRISCSIGREMGSGTLGKRAIRLRSSSVAPFRTCCRHKGGQTSQRSQITRLYEDRNSTHPHQCGKCRMVGG